MKLFVFDVDGTIVYNGGNISPEDQAAIQARLDQGDAIAICTGRPFAGALKYLSCFHGHQRWVVGSNGATLQDENGKMLYLNGYSYREFLEIRNRHLMIETKLGGTIYAYGTDGDLLTFMPNSWTKEEAEWNNLKVIDLNLDPRPLDSMVLKTMVAAKAEIAKTIVFSQEEKDRYHIVATDPRFREFMNHGVDKADGVERLRLHLGLKPEEVYTFGDQLNDLLMIKNYHGVAMGNAILECKQASSFVTKDVRESGVSYALKYFVK